MHQMIETRSLTPTIKSWRVFAIILLASCSGGACLWISGATNRPRWIEISATLVSERRGEGGGRLLFFLFFPSHFFFFSGQYLLHGGGGTRRRPFGVNEMLYQLS